LQRCRVAPPHLPSRAAATQGGIADAEELLMEVRVLVEEIVKAIVDHPEDVVVSEVEGSHSTVLELKVARDDVGKVIGKKGVHADAIRRLVHAIGGKQKRRYILEIIEDR
jgi:uncharacterized protein